MRTVFGTLVALAAAVGWAGAAGADSPLDFAPQAASAYSVINPATSDYGRAVAAFTERRYSTAVTRLEPLADGSDNPAVVLLTGFANLGAGSLGRAELYFNRGLVLDRSSPTALQGLGLTALARGDRAAAEARLAALEAAGQACAGQCTRADEIARASASLRRAIG